MVGQFFLIKILTYWNFLCESLVQTIGVLLKIIVKLYKVWEMAFFLILCRDETYFLVLNAIEELINYS